MSMLVYIYSQLREMSILGYTECDFREIDCNSKLPWKRPRLTTENEKDGDVDEEGLDDDDTPPAVTAATGTTTSDPHLVREEDASFRSLYRSGSVSFRTAEGTEWGGGSSDNNNNNTEYLLNTKKADFIIAAVLKELESEENNEKFKSTFDRYDTSIVKEFHKWVEDSRSDQLDDAAAAAIDATRKRALLASSRRSAAIRRAKAKTKAEAKLEARKREKKVEEKGEKGIETTTTSTDKDAARDKSRGERAAGAGAPQACDGGGKGGCGGADVVVFNDDDEDDDRAGEQRQILPSSSGTGMGKGTGMGMVRRKSVMDLTRIGDNNSANPAYDDDSVAPLLFPRDGSRSGGAERRLEERRDIATSSEAADGNDDDEEHRRSDDSNADVVSSTTPSSSSSSTSSLLSNNNNHKQHHHHHHFKPGSVLRGICESDVEVAWFGDRHPNEAIYSICVSRRTRTVTVVFRGSVNAHNWSHNVKCMMSEETNPLCLNDGEYNNYEGRSDSVRLHTGFSLYLLKQRRDDGRRKLDEIYDKIRSIGRELSSPPPPDDGDDGRGQEGGRGGGGYRLCVAGHSLGGALATLFSFFAASAKEGEFTTLAPVRVFTFAAPRVGDASFASAYRHLERTGRVLHARLVNWGDVVPLMPTHTFTASVRTPPNPTAPILLRPLAPPRTPLAESADDRAAGAGGGGGLFGSSLGLGSGLGGSGLLSAAGMYKHVGLQVKLHETNWLGAYRMGKALDVSYAKDDDWWTNVCMMWKNNFVSNFNACSLRGLREVHILSMHNRRLHFARQFRLGLGLAEYYSSGRQRNLKTLEEYYSIKAHHGGGGPPSRRRGAGGRSVAHIVRESAKRKKRLLSVAAVVLVLINCLHESGSPVCRAAGDRPAGRGEDDDESSSSLSTIIISAQRQKQKGEKLSSSSAGGGRRRGPNSSDEAEYHLAPAAGGTESRSGKDPLARGVGRHPHDEIKSHAPVTRGWGMMNGTGAPPSFVGREAAECAIAPYVLWTVPSLRCPPCFVFSQGGARGGNHVLGCAALHENTRAERTRGGGGGGDVDGTYEHDIES